MGNHAAVLSKKPGNAELFYFPEFLEV